MSISKQTLERDHSIPEPKSLIERMIESENMRRAYRKVKRNKGCAGIDGMTLEEAIPYLQKHWHRIREELLAGKYFPKAVKRVEIDKPNGGKRMLGIPTVTDRLIQQALHQILSPIFDCSFSKHSYGFRPGKSAHQAVIHAREYIRQGNRWVVDIDLKSFFDEVNHDRLMSLLAKRISDKKILVLVRRYLTTGVMVDGSINASKKGTPQGGPLSPLLSNIVLDELDKELEKRGHVFCRYADDCNIFVKSKRSGERVMESIGRFIEKILRLKVNHKKSAVGRPWNRIFLGYSFTAHKRAKLRVPKESVKKIKSKIKTLCRAGRGRNLKSFINNDLNPCIRGWINYFRRADVKSFAEDLDGWIRRRLRCILWRQWKRTFTRVKNLRKRGIEETRAWKSATNGRGPWWNAGASHMNDAFKKKFFDNIGLVAMLDTLLRFRIDLIAETAVYGTVCSVV